MTESHNSEQFYKDELEQDHHKKMTIRCICITCNTELWIKTEGFHVLTRIACPACMHTIIEGRRDQ